MKMVPVDLKKRIEDLVNVHFRYRYPEPYVKKLYRVYHDCKDVFELMHWIYENTPLYSGLEGMLMLYNMEANKTRRKCILEAAYKWWPGETKKKIMKMIVNAVDDDLALEVLLFRLSDNVDSIAVLALEIIMDRFPDNPIIEEKLKDWSMNGGKTKKRMLEKLKSKRGM